MFYLITKLYFVRHGQSIGNLREIYLGHTDLDLSELGHKQAAATAEHLKNVKFDAIYSSDLLRAHNTALPHAKMRGIEIIDSKNLREIFLGDWENMPVKKLVDEHYDDFVVGWKENYGTFTVPGGESVWGSGQRFYQEVLKIAEKHLGETVLITAHASVIRTFWGIISGVKPEELAAAVAFPLNASYSIAKYDGEKIIPIEYSNADHMPQELGGKPLR